MKTLKKGSYIVFQRPDTVETDTSQRTIPVRPQARAGRGSLRGAALHAVGLSGSAPFARPFFFFFPFFSLLRRYGTEKLPPRRYWPHSEIGPSRGSGCGPSSCLGRVSNRKAKLWRTARFYLHPSLSVRDTQVSSWSRISKIHALVR